MSRCRFNEKFTFSKKRPLHLMQWALLCDNRSHDLAPTGNSIWAKALKIPFPSTPYFPCQLGFRFSTKAAMPSF